MKPSSFSISRLAAAAVATALISAPAFAADLVGQPTNGAIDFQPGVTKLRNDVIHFHNGILMWVMVGISLLVLGLLLWCIFRFNAKANPVPARFTHNTTVEVLWTVGPVLILLTIAIVSFRLLFDYHDMPKPDLTVKATGYQWDWGYAYPDQKIDEYISKPLPEDQAKAAGVPYMLATNGPLVVPVNKTVVLQIPAVDVIHSFIVQSFGVRVDAVPGRLNETWFKADREGVYYGQCSKICGKDHAYMPIVFRVVSEEKYQAWLADSKKKFAAAPSAVSVADAGATEIRQ